MRRRLFASLASLVVLGLGCGFERRVEGRWQAEPGTIRAKELEQHGAPPAMAGTLVTSEFIAKGGVVYLGIEHPDAALLRYRVIREDGDCATVRFEGSGAAANPTTEVEACFLDDDALSLRHDGGKTPLEVTFRRL